MKLDNQQFQPSLMMRLSTMPPLHVLLLLLLLPLVVGQSDIDCLKCEDYLGRFCQCNRYDIYWNVDKRLYGISDCTGISQIPDFRRLCQTGDLWNIRLNGVPLSVIPNDAFLGVYYENTAQSPNFQPTIDLSNTGFTTVAQGSFEAVYNHLEQLILNDNGLTEVPAEVFKIKAITHLIMKGNKLRDLPKNLDGTLEKLQVLDISDNNLRDIPESMCDFPTLGEVDLQYNPIAGDLSDYIHILSKCANLKSLLWPKTTMRCTCQAMKHYSAEYSPQFSIPAKFRLTKGSSYRDMSLQCDKRSAPWFVGRPVEDITVGEVWRTCYNETCECCVGQKIQNSKSDASLIFINLRLIFATVLILVILGIFCQIHDV